MNMQPKLIKPLVTRVYLKDSPAIELTEEEASFCRKIGFWPGHMTMNIKNNEDLELAKQIAIKCNVKINH